MATKIRVSSDSAGESTQSLFDSIQKSAPHSNPQPADQQTVPGSLAGGILTAIVITPILQAAAYDALKACVSWLRTRGTRNKIEITIADETVTFEGNNLPDDASLKSIADRIVLSSKR